MIETPKYYGEAARETDTEHAERITRGILIDVPSGEYVTRHNRLFTFQPHPLIFVIQGRRMQDAKRECCALQLVMAMATGRR